MLTQVLHRTISVVANKPLSHWAPLIPPFIVSVLVGELANLERFNGWLVGILSLAASTILAVTTHRLILLGGPCNGHRSSFVYERRMESK